MLIALDYDGTYTRDKEMWDEVIAVFKKYGHEVVCDTMRYKDSESTEVELDLRNKVDYIVYTNRLAKIPEVKKQINKNPDIWIDDQPAWLFDDGI